MWPWREGDAGVCVAVSVAGGADRWFCGSDSQTGIIERFGFLMWVCVVCVVLMVRILD